MNDSILEKRLPKDNTDVKDDPYKTPTLAYNREMDQLVVANTINIKVEEENISRSNDEEESEGPKTTHLRDTMTNSNKERKNW
jgi:hypothetical protein